MTALRFAQSHPSCIQRSPLCRGVWCHCRCLERGVPDVPGWGSTVLWWGGVKVQPGVESRDGAVAGVTPVTYAPSLQV